jgi:hypothetical protein
MNHQHSSPAITCSKLTNKNRVYEIEYLVRQLQNRFSCLILPIQLEIHAHDASDVQALVARDGDSGELFSRLPLDAHGIHTKTWARALTVNHS